MATLTDKVVGKRLRQYRDEIGFTQEELAEGTNLTRTIISNIELGKTKLGVIEGKSICDFLGILLEDLLKVDSDSELESVILFRNGGGAISNEELLDRTDLIMKELFAQLELSRSERRSTHV
ncbi:anaerobic benzoate catabolism transcriptional regulator [compost metagenome]